MSDSTVAVMPHTLSVSGIGIDIIGILVGVFAIILVIKTLSKIGGQVGAAFRFTLFGVLAQMLALTFNIVTEELNLVSVPAVLFGFFQTHHIHDALMVIGIIFFVLAAREFSKLPS